MLRLIAAAATAALFTATTAAETLKIGHPIWVGNGPLFIAQEQDYFAEEGVDVELLVYEDPKTRFPALDDGKIDALVTSVDTVLNFLETRQDYRYLFAMDDSNGGDGVVAKTGITSIADLKGKTVAYSTKSVSEFFFGVLLKDSGLAFSDIDTRNMTAAEAGEAFIAGKVDAAVTWEPWLTRGKNVEHGRLLSDSSRIPGMLTDVMLANEASLKTHLADFKAVYRAWNRAVAFQQKHPDEADLIMAKGAGGWLADPKIFAETRAGIAYYDEAMNRSFIGKPGEPGGIAKTLNYAIAIGEELGRFKLDIDPTQLIVTEIVH